MRTKRLGYKTRCTVTAALLCMGMVLTACGSKEQEKISEYGGEGVTTAESSAAKASEDPARTEDGNTTQTKEPVDRSSAIESAEAKSNQPLREKLGGEQVSYKETFSIGDIPMSMEINYAVPDISVLPSYKVTSASAKLLSEGEIVKNLFGDSAAVVKRALSIAKGDSERVLADCQSVFYEIYPDSYDSSAWEHGIPDCSAWEDGTENYYHTYEGTYNGTEYQLMIGRNGEDQIISFYPKNPGTLIGRPELSRGEKDLGGIIHYGDPVDRTKDFEISLDQLSDPENQVKAEESTLTASAIDFLREKMGVILPEGNIVIGRTYNYSPDVSSSSLAADSADTGHLNNLIFANPDDLGKGSLGQAVMNGYEANIAYTLFDLTLASYLEMYQGNTGSFWLTDAGVVGMTLHLTYNFEEKLSENVPILSFENAMASFRNGVEESLDMSKVTGASITADYAELAYYAIPSPDKKGEATFVPVWVIPLKSGSYEFGAALVNAMDGSIIEIFYTADMR